MRINHLVIVPFDDLFSLPFAALSDQDEKHLIKKYNLSFVPSIGTLVKLANWKNSNSSRLSDALIVGNPNYHGWMSRVSCLELYMLYEAKQVCDILTAECTAYYDVKIIEGANATKEV